MSIAIWSRVRQLFGHCPSGRYVPGSLGEPRWVWCTGDAKHPGDHSRGYRTWRKL